MGSATPAKKISRRERERLNRRLEILSAAETIFARNGYHEASIAEIASEAEFAPGTVYLYFEGKEVLFAAVFERKIAELIRVVRENLSDDGSIESRLYGLISAQLKYFGDNRDFFRIFTQERMDRNKRPEWEAVWELFREYRTIIREIVVAGQSCKLFREGDPEQWALALTGIINNITRNWLEQGTDKPLTDQAEFVFEFVMNGIRNSSS